MLLEVEGLTKSYGAQKVIDNLSLSLNGGERLGVIGPNGAGKTTLFNLIAGNVRSDAGRVVLEGRDVSGDPLFIRSRKGIARAFQIPQPFPNMTVFENVLVGAGYGGGLQGQFAEEEALQVLRTTGLGFKADLPAGALSLLDRKRLELARALATRPKLLLLDEIAGGLTELEVQELVALIQGLQTPERGIIWIEHIAHALLAFADRILVLDHGTKLMEGDPHAVMKSDQVRDIYMGIPVDELSGN